MTGQIRAALAICLTWQFCLLLPCAAVPVPGVQALADPLAVVPAAEGLAWMSEDGGPAEILQVLKGKLDDRFLPAPEGAVPMDGHPVWLRLRVVDNASERVRWGVLLDEWALRDIQLYRPSGRGDWEASQAGSGISDRLLEFEGRVWQFGLAANPGYLPSGQVQTVYLRVEAPLCLTRLPVWLGSEGQLLAKQARDNLTLTLIGGAYCLLVLICLILFLGVVDRVYLICTVFAGLLCLQYLVTSGMVAALVGAGAAERWLAHIPELSQLYLASGLLLLLSFLSCRDLFPRLHRFSVVLAAVLAGMALAGFTLPESWVVPVKLPVILAALAVAGALRLALPLLALARGRRTALIYLAATLVEMAGTAAYLARAVGAVSPVPWLDLVSRLGGGLQLLIILYGVTLLVRQLRVQLESSNQRLTALNRELEERVHQQTAALEQERNKLAKLAMEDDLTGLLSRRAIMARCEEEHQRFVRYGKPYSLLMIDLDHFKLVNDTWGHATGDQVLKGLAGVLGASLRATDQAGRVGGEEFLVLLPETGAEQAFTVSEKIRDRLADLDFEGRPDRRFMVSCSIGVAEIRPGHPGWHRLMQDADAALYEAKEAGRNRTVVSRR
jgi:diguanylate cyclase (GGDEF)-like protein